MIHFLFAKTLHADNIPHAPLTAQKLQRACIDYREKVTTSGHFELRFRLEKFSPSQEAWESSKTVFVAGENIRFDIRDAFSADDSHKEQIVITPVHYIWAPRPGHEVTVAPINEYQSEPGGAAGQFGVFHPKWIGMGLNSESRMNYDLSARTLSGNAVNTAWTVPTLNEAGYHVIHLPSSPTATKSRLTLQFDLKRGCNLVKAEATYFDANGNATLSKTMTAALAEWPHPTEGYVWFPKEVQRETLYKGVATERSTLQVLSATFSAPADDIFTINGLGLNESTRVSDRTAGIL